MHEELDCDYSELRGLVLVGVMYNHYDGDISFYFGKSLEDPKIIGVHVTSKLAISKYGISPTLQVDKITESKTSGETN